jgi:hypothetical protein
VAPAIGATGEWSRARRLGHLIRHDPLHAMRFRPPAPPQVRDRRLAQRPTWSDRECPLDTAGDRCVWHVGGTAGENDDDARAAGRSAPAGRSTLQVRARLGDDLVAPWAPSTRRPFPHDRSSSGETTVTYSGW